MLDKVKTFLQVNRDAIIETGLTVIGLAVGTVIAVVVLGNAPSESDVADGDVSDDLDATVDAD